MSHAWSQCGGWEQRRRREARGEQRRGVSILLGTGEGCTGTVLAVVTLITVQGVCTCWMLSCTTLRLLMFLFSSLLYRGRVSGGGGVA